MKKDKSYIVPAWIKGEYIYYVIRGKVFEQYRNGTHNERAIKEQVLWEKDRNREAID